MNIKDMIDPQQDPAGELAEFAANLRYEDIPDEHVDFIKRDILDAMASIIGGSTASGISTVMDSVRSWGTTGDVPVFVFGDRLPDQLAAFANGMIGRALDLGDTGVTGGHVCEWIIPTLLSGLNRAGKPISGKEFITAFAVGAEWGTREHTTIRLLYHNMVIPGECAGSRYLTTALAKMYGFDKEQIWDAAGMAFCSRTMTTQQKYIEGTAVDFTLQHGFASAEALQIADLVKRGCKSVHGIYMGRAGLLKNLPYSDIESPDTLTENLGTHWLWKENITNKLYSSCYFTHTPLYGTLALMKENKIQREDIQSLHFIISSSAEQCFIPREVRLNPKTPEAAKFSTYYVVVNGIFTGDCFLDSFQKERIQQNMNNPEFRDLMNRITYEIDPDNQEVFDDFTVVCTLKDGRIIRRFTGDLPGNRKTPVTWEKVLEKFNKTIPYSAVNLGKEKYNRIIEICRNLENVQDMECLMDSLIP